MHFCYVLKHKRPENIVSSLPCSMLPCTLHLYRFSKQQTGQSKSASGHVINKSYKMLC